MRKILLLSATAVALSFAPSVGISQTAAPGGGSDQGTMPSYPESGRAMQPQGPRAKDYGTKAPKQNMGRSAAETGAGTGIEGRSAYTALDTQQQNRVREMMIERRIAPAANANFDISVGSVVPRTVKAYALPARVVRIIPAYRGYKFFKVRNELVIVNPRTHEIMAVIPA